MNFYNFCVCVWCGVVVVNRDRDGSHHWVCMSFLVSQNNDGINDLGRTPSTYHHQCLLSIRNKDLTALHDIV